MAADLLVDLFKRAAINRGVASLQKRIGQYYSDSDDDNTNQFASNQRQGLGSILGRTAAFGLLGPILGPIAFALGKGIMGRRNKMSLMPSGDPNQITSDPRGTFTAEGMQFENIQDALGSTDPNKDINYNTGVITDKTTGKEIGNVYDEGALTNVPEPPAYDFDDSSDSGSGGGSSSASTAGDAPGYSGPSPFRYGGLASLYR